jgi:transposase-like protein
MIVPPKAAYKSVRLTLNAASREFGISRTTLRSKLASTEPGDDSCYSIEQVYLALNSDLTELKKEEVRARTKHYELRNEAIRRFAFRP